MIVKHCGTIVQKSSIYESKPWGYQSFNNYLNQVVEIESLLNPNELLNTLLDIETKQGRIRQQDHYEDRPIDLDIILYSSTVCKDQKLTIPHPEYHNRIFVLKPLTEISPDFKDPISKKKVSQLLNECQDETNLIRYE